MDEGGPNSVDPNQTLNDPNPTMHVDKTDSHDHEGTGRGGGCGVMCGRVCGCAGACGGVRGFAKGPQGPPGVP